MTCSPFLTVNHFLKRVGICASNFLSATLLSSVNMAERAEERTVTLDEQSLGRLMKAKREGESFSDVILRLFETKVAALERRVASQLRPQYFLWTQNSWDGDGKARNRSESRTSSRERLTVRPSS